MTHPMVIGSSLGGSVMDIRNRKMNSFISLSRLLSEALLASLLGLLLFTFPVSGGIH